MIHTNDQALLLELLDMTAPIFQAPDMPGAQSALIFGPGQYFFLSF